MGIEEKGQVCVMIHSGSRGFGHQVATGVCKLYLGSVLVLILLIFYYLFFCPKYFSSM